MSFRGLHNFIQEIRTAPSAEAEKQRIEEEIHKIRQFFSGNAKSNTQYNNLKQLGYQIDFGLVSISQLMASQDKQNKLVGYLVLSQILYDFPELLKLLTQTVLTDLQSGVVFNQQLALDFVANCGDAEMAEVLAGPVLQIISNSDNSCLRKKAVLALLNLCLKNKDCVGVSAVEQNISTWLEQRNVGFLTCLMHLVWNMADQCDFEPIKHRCIYLLQKIIIKNEVSDDHKYYDMPCPWLQISLLRFLQKLSPELHSTVNQKTQVVENEQVMMRNIIEKVFKLTEEVYKNGLQSKLNIHWAICMEICQIYSFYKNQLEDEEFDIKFMFDTIRSVQVTSNVKYAALQCLISLSSIDYVLLAIKQNLQQLAFSIIVEKDYAIRHVGLQLLFSVVDSQTAQAVCSSLVYCAKLQDTPENYKLDAVLKVIEICSNNEQSWTISQLLTLLPLCDQHAVNNIINLLQKRINKENYKTTLKELTDLLNDQPDDKQLLTIFSYIFLKSFKYMNEQEIKFSVDVVLHAILILNSRDTEQAYIIACTSLLVLIGEEVVDQSYLNPMLVSEVVEVQQRACEVYGLISLGFSKKIAELYKLD